VVHFKKDIFQFLMQYQIRGAITVAREFTIERFPIGRAEEYYTIRMGEPTVYHRGEDLSTVDKI